MHNFDPFKHMNNFGFDPASNPFMDLMKQQSQTMMEIWQKSLTGDPKKMKTYFEDTFSQNMKKFDAYFTNQQKNPQFQEYRKAYLAYLSHLNDFSSKALNQMFDKSQFTPPETFSPQKASEMYRVWLESCEKLYETEKLNKQYQKLYTDMVNTWGKWKSHSKK